MNQRCSDVNLEIFTAKKSALILDFWSVLIQKKIKAGQLWNTADHSDLKLYESALKNVKSLKQRSSALIICVTSNRVFIRTNSSQ